MSGEEIAGILGEDPEKVFKALVTQGKSGTSLKKQVFRESICANEVLFLSNHAPGAF